jgi:hypothetical protein
VWLAFFVLSAHSTFLVFLSISIEAKDRAYQNPTRRARIFLTLQGFSGAFFGLVVEAKYRGHLSAVKRVIQKSYQARQSKVGNIQFLPLKLIDVTTISKL